MRIDNPTPAKRAQIFTALDARLKRMGEPAFVKYLQLGSQVVRLINHSKAFTHHVDMQLGYILKDTAESYDATMHIWQEKDIADVSLCLIGVENQKMYRDLRLKRITNRNHAIEGVWYHDDSIWYNKPFVECNPQADIFMAFNPDTNTYYYSVADLSLEEFIKKGHAFVQTFSKILKTPTSNLGHGAIVGVNNTGVLMCGIGYRGKSTFAVSALMDGMDYVSDDYLILEKKGEELLSWPIYSIITLSPHIYQTMQARLNAKFVSNNARKDKYVFNIAAYHDQFKNGYPVKLCMYPRFTPAAEPSIEPGDKDIAIQELIMSALRQMGDAEDVQTITKKYNFVADLPFYRFNLTKNIDKNTRFLRKFLEEFSEK